MIDWFRRGGSSKDALSSAERLAFTNLMAAEIRRRLVNPREVYVKWWYGGAYNGCAWVDDERNAIVSFYESRPRKGIDAHTQAREFSQGWITVSPEFISSDHLAEFVGGCEERFRQIQANDPGLVSRVARLQIWFTLLAQEQSVAGERVTNLVSALTSAVPGRVTSSPVQTMPGPSTFCDADIEMELATVEPEIEVIQALQPVLPGLTGSLFGLGASWRSETGQTCAVVTARQF